MNVRREVLKNINDILIENEKILIKKIKKSEEQIENGNIKDGDIVLSEMRKKYGY